MYLHGVHLFAFPFFAEKIPLGITRPSVASSNQTELRDSFELEFACAETSMCMHRDSTAERQHRELPEHRECPPGAECTYRECPPPDAERKHKHRE